MHKEIGKIGSVTFGMGGYQDVMVGFTFQLEGEGWGTVDFKGSSWAHVSKEDLEKPNSNYKWTHESRIKSIGEVGWTVIELMKQAKVTKLQDLKNKPIEATFDSPCGKLLSFRILTEVL